ncbi:MAG: DUF2851 family protein, partial [Aliifodinibius sp.]|nr:DUF2851 family protein [candidate division Zixibacteria bacterium]NIT61131.1 DUF2851 family protein [Fodinibius sp.]NIS48587.1 DUF2851 family protein [candidate division Zixibacteria bacterium]NIU13122.1 DUF2851 family protein [candidate division Zixibacteria bacterium]NIV08826.1 DUF2851 family protein [candidate division Zixibacteria bacterium]
MAQDLLEQIKIPEYWLSWTYFQSHLLRSPLIGLNQERVNIIDHGRQNYDNGPDVLDATIEINGIRYQGDVEFHLAAQDWFLHGH